MVSDQKGHASRHSDGGSDELDAADLAGGSGTSGQLLQTDGSAASWVDFQSGSDVSDDGTLVVSAPTDVNYSTGLAASDDGDGSVTVNIPADGVTSTELDTTDVYSFGPSDNNLENRIELQDNKFIAFFDESSNQTGSIGYQSAIGYDLKFDGFSTIEYSGTQFNEVTGITNLNNSLSFDALVDNSSISFTVEDSQGNSKTAGSFDTDSSDNFRLDMNNNLVSNVSNPSGAQDAATKNYVDDNTLHISDNFTTTGGASSGDQTIFIDDTFKQRLDGFEDGNFSSSPTWTEIATNGTATIQSSTVKNGSNALEVTTSGSGDHFLQNSSVGSLTVTGDGVDDFETGSSQLGWESSSGFSIDSTSQVTGTNSLKIASSNETVTSNATYQNPANSLYKVVQMQVKIDNQTGTEGDYLDIGFQDSSTDIARVKFAGNGELKVVGIGVPVSGQSSWSQGTIHEVEVVFDFSNNDFTVYFDGANIFDGNTGNPLDGSVSTSQMTDGYIENSTGSSGSIVNAYIDDMTYNPQAVDGDELELWFRTDTQSTSGFYALTNENGNPTGTNSLYFDEINGNFRLETYDNTGSPLESISFSGYSTNTWFKVETEINPSHSLAVCRIYDTSDNLVNSASAYTQGVETYSHTILGVSDEASGSAFFDDVSYDYTRNTTLTLGSSDKNVAGKEVRVVDAEGAAASSGGAQVVAENSLINGEKKAVLNSDYEALTMQSDGDEWYIVGHMEGGETI